MTVHWSDILGWSKRPADYGPRHSHEGICFHTTEPPNGERIDHAALLATFRWQADQSSGSYNMGVAMSASGEAGLGTDSHVVTAVPMDHASGGLSTRRDYVWAPHRYPWLKELLTPRTYGDPNGGLLNVVIQGRVSWWMVRDGSGRTRYQRAPALIDALARIVIEFERRYKRDAVLCDHTHWQTNRSDSSPASHLINLVLNRYAEIKGQAATPAPAPSTPEAPADMQIVPVEVFAPGTSARFAPHTTYQFFRPDGKGGVERKAYTLTDRGSSALAGARCVDRMVDGAKPCIAFLNGWPAAGGWLLSGWGPQPELVAPAPEPTADDMAGELASLRAALTEAEDQAEEMAAVIEALRADDEADARALREAEKVRDDALAAAAEIEGMVSGYVEALDALRDRVTK